MQWHTTRNLSLDNALVLLVTKLEPGIELLEIANSQDEHEFIFGSYDIQRFRVFLLHRETTGSYSGWWLLTRNLDERTYFVDRG